MKTATRAEQVVKIESLPQGFAIQVYNQTVITTRSEQEALRLAEGLRTAFR